MKGTIRSNVTTHHGHHRSAGESPGDSLIKSSQKRQMVYASGVLFELNEENKKNDKNLTKNQQNSLKSSKGTTQGNKIFPSCKHCHGTDHQQKAHQDVLVTKARRKKEQ